MANVKDIVESVLIEYRPRIRSVNVIIKFNFSFSNISASVVDHNLIQILLDGKVTVIDCDVDLRADSINILYAADNYVSLRAASEIGHNNTDGSNIEVLRHSVNSNNRDRSLLMNLSQFPLGCRILCNFCTQQLSSRVTFERVLPLPSEHFNITEMFCHSTISDPLSNARQTDLLYSKCYFEVHKTLVDNVLENHNLLICKRCLAWLGIVRNSKTAKLWFNTTSLQGDDLTYKTNAIDDVFDVLKDAFDNVLYSSTKLILSYKNIGNRIEHIIIWVFEKELHLKVILNGEQFKTFKGCKVLFKYEDSSSEETVKRWKQDLNVNCCTISKIMAVELMKHLYKFNMAFPIGFRKSNDFSVSYIIMS